MLRTTILALFLSLFSVSILAGQPKPPIPELSPQKALAPFITRGFNLTGPNPVQDGPTTHYRWELKAGDTTKNDYSVYAKLWSHTNQDTLYNINITAFGGRTLADMDRKLTANLFRAVASLEYVNAEPEKAAAWIIKNMNSEDAETVIGGIKLSTYLDGNNWHLDIRSYEEPVEFVLE
ncbi:MULTISPECIES: hypothetical protein [unclassified Neptuniibacter]|uniref:hypothetical protein n=1 Tax=unclassified Neptuniibacter TaxID=2630693 RepID=UPI0025E92BDB|nr:MULTISPECIES: hypothetical protein [unclassified Neptuniibacter]|tara:strand:+ start:2581 stop:3114 length:534 start_codon:yes stop_codon:yes gene_type:complete